MDCENKENVQNSEIINQKKQFIFNVEQTSKYVFPNEIFYYYVYIKNISGTEINNFIIQIENPEAVCFDSNELNDTPISLKSDETKLYKFKVYCDSIGEHIVHFIAYGEETQLLYKTLKITCSKISNSDKITHRIHIYNFSPYEEAYSLEATNYSDSVTQLFKRQRLPYKSGKQPFHKKVNSENTPVNENTEPQSFLDQYNEAKNNTSEHFSNHVYQYLGRENFTEESIEVHDGDTLFDIVNRINKESEYFKARLLRTGTNELLNDFREFKPNGFIHRMGLLNSEIYHNLGVIPTYSYMSDYLFRWAPSENQLLNLTPQKHAMNWNQNVWAGKGWLVYKIATPEYIITEDFQKLKEECNIESWELIADFEDKESAENYIKRNEDWDKEQRYYEKSDLVKYKYILRESIYDTGIFFINIPINKVPVNFYIPTNKNLYALINRAKPFGTKPIINYIVENNFNHNMSFKVGLNYHKPFSFKMDCDLSYEITQYKIRERTITCEETNNPFSYLSLDPVSILWYKDNFLFNHNHSFDVDSTQVGSFRVVDGEMEEETSVYKFMSYNNLLTLKNTINLIYQENYNNIAFYINNEGYTAFESDDINTQSIKIKTENKYRFKDDTELILSIKDIEDKEYQFCVKYDNDLKMEYIYYKYINANNKIKIRKEGYQNINSLVFIFGEINNKKIIFFMTEGTDNKLHYFHHIIIHDIISFDCFEKTNDETISIKKELLHNTNILDEKIVFETPFVYSLKKYQPKIVSEGGNWTNLYRLNNQKNSYSYIKNTTNGGSITPNNIVFKYDNINIPETSSIKKIRLKLLGTNSPKNKAYLYNSFNTNYILPDVTGYELQLEPSILETYSSTNNSTTYYKLMLNIAKEKNQNIYINKFEKLVNENYLFDENLNLSTKYLSKPESFISIQKPFWIELSDFTKANYNLNNIKTMKFVIEGYNSGGECQISSQTLYETSESSTITETIPSGYFRKKISLPYPNNYLIDFLRVRFKFDNLNHLIKIFDTKLELEFKNKEKDREIVYNFVKDIDFNNISIVSMETSNPSDLNNGLMLKFEFDDINPGEFYQINYAELEIIYQDMDLNMMISDNKLQDNFFDKKGSSVSGIVSNAYLSGEFYDDVITMSQSEIDTNNKGIILREALYQSFDTRSDNITSIELFPHGFKGNPDSILKISLYDNLNNTPNKLLKEIHAEGWNKNNIRTNNLRSIKYNFNIDNLKINTRYWFKVEVLNPKENSYYLLKGINETKDSYKLLAEEDNNYINTFSCLKFNIYSKNLSKSFNNLDAIQNSFNNPYVLIGLHKGVGTIKNLKTNKPF